MKNFIAQQYPKFLPNIQSSFNTLSNVISRIITSSTLTFGQLLKSVLLVILEAKLGGWVLTPPLCIGAGGLEDNNSFGRDLCHKNIANFHTWSSNGPPQSTIVEATLKACRAINLPRLNLEAGRPTSPRGRGRPVWGETPRHSLSSQVSAET